MDNTYNQDEAPAYGNAIEALNNNGVYENNSQKVVQQTTSQSVLNMVSDQLMMT